MASELCPVCGLRQRGLVVYEDDEVTAVLADPPAQAGQLRVFPTKHFTILEQLPAALVARLFILANKASTALFESLNMQGTNLWVKNGVAAGQIDPHVVIEVIPRLQGDNLKLEWQLTTQNEDEMSTVELILREALELPAEEPKPVTPTAPHTVSADNYLTMHLRRVP